ncbi:MAG TPA: hypothetical protein VK163_01350 [Opitutaceae bacterium]|nr:hypothetical protein [Opitutaceae bacterium]
MIELDGARAQAAYAEFRTRFDSAAPAADLVATAGYFTAACETGAVPPLTLDDEDLAEAPDDTRERIRAVYDRLRRLGYAPLPSEPTSDWRELRPAFAEFQREAGLCSGGRICGELTRADWRALQEIFDFETPMEVPRWFSGDVPSPALERATRLRLSVFGFGSVPRADDWRPAAGSMAAFAEVVQALGLTDEPLPPALTPAFAATLFGHDALAARIAARSAPLPASARVRDFLVCLAKVELWLHGFDIAPDGNPALTVRTFHAGRHGRWSDEPSPVANFIVRACEDLFADPAVARPPKRPEQIPDRVPALLAALERLRRDAETRTAAAARDSAALIGRLQERLDAEPRLWARIREVGRKLTGALFDGVKRAVAWLARFFAKAIDWTVNALANAWRTVYHFMGSAAMRLRRALRTFADGVDFFTAGLVTDTAGQIACAKSGDFDLRVLVDERATADEARAYGAGLRRRSRAFAIACRMIRLVATALRAALTSATAAIGGFVPLLLGLASAYSQIRELDRLLESCEADTDAAELRCR